MEELEDERRRRVEAEQTLALLREKTKEKFLALKTENENLKKMISELSEQKSNDSEWLGLQESLRAVESERKSMIDENSKLKQQISVLTEVYDRHFHGLPLHTVTAGEKHDEVWVITEVDRVFRASKAPGFPDPLDSQVGTLEAEINNIREKHAKESEIHKSHIFDLTGKIAQLQSVLAEMIEKTRTPPQAPAVPDSVVEVRRPVTGPWSLEKDRLMRMLDNLEDMLEDERRQNRDSVDELAELRKLLKEHEENQSLISSDATKIIYAKNVFSKLFSLAPQGCPEFEQLLLVLCAFFQVPLEEAASQRKARLEAAHQKRSGFFPF